jgi:hypothetical protein
MMLVVAGAAVLCIPLTLWQRSVRFREMSLLCSHKMEIIPFNDLEMYLLVTPTQIGHEGEPGELQRIIEEDRMFHSKTQSLEHFAEYYRALKAKYEAAAAHPWRSVPLDPPPPPDPSFTDLKIFRAFIDTLDTPRNEKSERLFRTWYEANCAVMTAPDGSLPSSDFEER